MVGSVSFPETRSRAVGGAAGGFQHHARRVDGLNGVVIVLFAVEVRLAPLHKAPALNLSLLCVIEKHLCAVRLAAATATAHDVKVIIHVVAVHECEHPAVEGVNPRCLDQLPPLAVAIVQDFELELAPRLCSHGAHFNGDGFVGVVDEGVIAVLALHREPLASVFAVVNAMKHSVARSVISYHYIAAASHILNRVARRFHALIVRSTHLYKRPLLADGTLLFRPQLQSGARFCRAVLCVQRHARRVLRLQYEGLAVQRVGGLFAGQGRHGARQTADLPLLIITARIHV